MVKYEEANDGWRHPEAQRVIDYITRMPAVQESVKYRKRSLIILACHWRYGRVKGHLPPDVLQWLIKSRSRLRKGGMSEHLAGYWKLMDEILASPAPKPNPLPWRMEREKLRAAAKAVMPPSQRGEMSVKIKNALMAIKPVGLIKNPVETWMDTIWWYYASLWRDAVSGGTPLSNASVRHIEEFLAIVEEQMAENGLSVQQREVVEIIRATLNQALSERGGRIRKLRNRPFTT